MEPALAIPSFLEAWRLCIFQLYIVEYRLHLWPALVTQYGQMELTNCEPKPLETLPVSFSHWWAVICGWLAGFVLVAHKLCSLCIVNTFLPTPSFCQLQGKKCSFSMGRFAHAVWDLSASAPNHIDRQTA